MGCVHSTARSLRPGDISLLTVELTHTHLGSVGILASSAKTSTNILGGNLLRSHLVVGLGYIDGRATTRSAITDHPNHLGDLEKAQHKYFLPTRDANTSNH